MSDSGPDNLVLNMLRQMRGKLDDLKADMTEAKERLGFLEGGLASLSRRLDRVAGNAGEIKRRLELTDAPR